MKRIYAITYVVDAAAWARHGKLNEERSLLVCTIAANAKRDWREAVVAGDCVPGEAFDEFVRTAGDLKTHFAMGSYSVFDGVLVQHARPTLCGDFVSMRSLALTSMVDLPDGDAARFTIELLIDRLKTAFGDLPMTVTEYRVDDSVDVKKLTCQADLDMLEAATGYVWSNEADGTSVWELTSEPFEAMEMIEEIERALDEDEDEGPKYLEINWRPS